MTDYIYRILIGKAGVTSDATGLTDIAEGELLVVDNTFTPLTPGDTTEDAPEIYIVKGNASGNAHKMSAKIVGKNITKFAGTSYAAAVQQVSYIGYNTNAGAINASNSTEYSLSVVFKHDKELWSKQPAKRTYHYTSDASATQAEIAAAFVALMNADAEFARQAVAATVNSGADYGIRITGLALTKQFIDDYMQVRFEIAIDKGFDSTVPVDQFGYIQTNGSQTATGNQSVNPSPGVGTAALVEDLERRALAFMGVTNLIKFPVPNYPKDVVAGETYDIYAIEHFDRHKTDELLRTRDFPHVTLIAVPVSNTGMTTYLESILNPYISSVGFSNVAL